MIDFRYHLVSIVAIFLALAVGIVLGTTLLQEPALKSAEELTAQLAKTKEELRTQVNLLQGREAGNDAFVSELTPKLVAGELNGEHVLLIEAPGSSSANREAQHQVLLQAGAAITGRVTLTDKYLDPANAGLIDGLVNQLKPADMVFPEGAATYDKASTLLAATLMTTDQGQAGTANQATAAVLDGFETGGLLSVDDEPKKRATLAVMFAPEEPFEGKYAAVQAGALASLAGGLDAGGKGTVMTGSGSSAVGPGGALTTVRDDGDMAKRVSTVDTPDMPAGQIVIVYALREQARGGVGQYGIGAGASGPMPALPTSSPSPSNESGS
ncbi:copper transporter [Nonomuraea cavernae]|uniref:Copper transporter n=1 Tax=Nonomuraea cavernae TaxID=2045107 RepID=A0A917Z7C1_9ACTN|nr:copper transporter [Nonomuraea cavernae]MCA2189057.1 copper transporter [Nonomuraea cavernae]GGO76031.1 hypothetical protein GCM10012289_52450 [Nonomuraea cavernae]